LQSLFIARERDRLEGVHEILDALAAQNPFQPGLAVAAAWVRMHNGLLDEARAQLETFAAADFTSLRRTATWTATISMLADLYTALDGRRESELLYAQAHAARHHFAVVPRIVVFLGSMELTLGNLAVTAGRLDTAVEHLDAAREAHALLEAPLLVTRTDLARARVLRMRGEHADAEALLADIAAEAEAAGWTAVAREAAALRKR
jgi:ATP/maltotriose-dependent transcriptional regulator MalT